VWGCSQPQEGEKERDNELALGRREVRGAYRVVRSHGAGTCRRSREGKGQAGRLIARLRGAADALGSATRTLSKRRGRPVGLRGLED